MGAATGAGCHLRRPVRRGTSGQAMVEFTLIIPILLMIFVAIADFGRIFAASIAIEAATRDAAEAVANRYVASWPGPLDQPAPAVTPRITDRFTRTGRASCARNCAT